MPPVVELSQSVIENMRCPDGKSKWELCDRVVPGLYIEVREGSPGVGSFRLRYKDRNRKTCHRPIGKTSEMLLNVAREKAIQLKKEIVTNGAPADVVTAKQELTLAKFFDEHYIPFVKLRKRGWKKDQSLFDLRIRKALGDKKLSQLARHQIQSFHMEVKDEGLAPASADHYLKLVRAVLNKAVEFEMLDKNPVLRAPLFNQRNQIDCLLSPEELGRLVQTLHTHPNRDICRLCLFLLSTGARLNEAVQAKRSEIDVPNRLWLIPAHTAKSKKVRSVPLNDSALAVLKELETEEEHELLFPSRRTGKPWSGIHRQWVRVREAAGLPTLRIHDLRHTLASVLVNSGRSLYEVQMILGHSSPIVTQRYAHLSTRSMQDAAASASAVLQSALKGTT
jgi:integrase